MNNIENLPNEKKDENYEKSSGKTLFNILIILLSVICVPIFAISSVAFMISGAFAIIAILAKYLDSILLLGLPYVELVRIEGLNLEPALELVVGVAIGAVVFIIGTILWKLLMFCIRSIRKLKRKL